MDKTLKIFLIVIVTLLVANLITGMLNIRKDNLSNAIDSLSKANSKLEATLESVNQSRREIDSVRVDLIRFRAYIKDVQTRVEAMDLRYKKGTEEYKNVRDSIAKRLKELKLEDLTGDNLPDIYVVSADSIK